MTMVKKKFTIRDKCFVDSNGNQVVLHGINMVCKDKERNYIGDYQESDFEMLRQWGFNVIRLGLIWDGVEPNPGHYDEAYLQSIDRFIELAGQNDIAVYLDMHQDLFSSCYGDGAPAWATLCEGVDHVQTELWSEAYLISPAVQNAFDQFWNDAPAEDGVGIQTHFINMWRHLAMRYAKNSNVIGYDFFNEPFPGSAANLVMMDLIHTLQERMQTEDQISEEEIMGMWMDPEQKLSLLKEFEQKEKYEGIVQAIGTASKEFDKTAMSDFYQRLGDAVREVDEVSLLFVEANYFCNTGVESAVKPIQNEQGQTDPYQVYSPHGYDLLVDTDMYDQSSFDRLSVIFESHKRVQERLGLPMLVGEWGCFPNAKAPECEQAEYLLQVYGKMGVSHTYFDFSHIKNNPIVKVLVRPYPMCVNGNLLSSHYDRENERFECTWREDGDNGNTMIYLPDTTKLKDSDLVSFGAGVQIVYCNQGITDNEYKNAGYLLIPASCKTTQRTLSLNIN